MGQRLNIEIVKGENLLANSYYHWAGYTSCSLDMAVDIIKRFDYIKKYKVENVKDKDTLLAIRLLEETGAGTSESEETEIIKKIGLIDENVKTKACRGRNEGIINITEEGIKENRAWEEGRITIDIESQKVKFDVFHKIPEEDIKEYEEDGDKFEEININFESIKFEDIFDIKAFIDKQRYKSQYRFKNKFDNKYISLIE